jgi:hypothetical protein
MRDINIKTVLGLTPCSLVDNNNNIHGSTALYGLGPPLSEVTRSLCICGSEGPAHCRSLVDRYQYFGGAKGGEGRRRKGGGGGGGEEVGSSVFLRINGVCLPNYAASHPVMQHIHTLDSHQYRAPANNGNETWGFTKVRGFLAQSR